MKLIESLPKDYIAIGDCAYPASEKLVPIFGADLALQKSHNNFNYFASQCRIRIEMTFGIMVKKWTILSCPITTRLSNIKWIVKAIAILHNYCINQREYTVQVNDSSDGFTCTQISQMRASAEAEYKQKVSDEFPQWSMARERLVNRVKNMGLQRPVRNQRSQSNLVDDS